MSDLPLKSGDAVTWTHVLKPGTGYSFQARSGVILAIDAKLPVASVRCGNGRRVLVAKKELRLAGHRTALTESFELAHPPAL